MQSDLCFFRKLWRSPFSINSISMRTGSDLVTIPISFTTCSDLGLRMSHILNNAFYLHPSIVDASWRISQRSFSPASLCRDFIAHFTKDSCQQLANLANFDLPALSGFPCRLFQNYRFPTPAQYPHDLVLLLDLNVIPVPFLWVLAAFFSGLQGRRRQHKLSVLPRQPANIEGLFVGCQVLLPTVSYSKS